MKSVLKKSIVIILVLSLTIVCASLLAACSSIDKRVQNALDKMETYEALEVEGNVEATMEFGSMGQTMDMDSTFDMKSVNEDIAMIMEVSSNMMDMTMEVYMVGDNLYMRMPALLDKYIDASDMLEQINEQGIGMDLTVFDFDVDATELEAEDTTIRFDGKEIDVLEVKVLLNDEQLTSIIKNLFAQQNFSTDTLTGQGLDQAASMYESIVVETAQYTLFIDKNNDVKRYDIDTIFSMEIMGEEVHYDMLMEYNIIKTGEGISVSLPDISPEDIITINDLYNGNF